jgi:hypothetical protein
MNKLFAASGVALLVVAGSPLVAQDIDGGTITCAEYTDADAATKIQAVGAVRVFIKESANSEAAGAAALAGDLTDEELMGRVDQGCVSGGPTITLVDALKL